MPAYLDHCASTPLRPEAFDAMVPHLRDQYANPSGAHTMARAARKAIDEARDTMAELLGFEPREIVFTSGGTEADNLAVLGVHDRRGGRPVAAAIEHPAVLDPVRARGGRLVGVDARGVIDLDALSATLQEAAGGPDPVTLVSTMLVNNEVGTIQPLTEVAAHVRALAPGALLHTDAVQALSWLDVADAARDADLVAVSGHKFGGPKGAGVLAVREGAAAAVAPRVLGGGQERERRSGTQNVAAIVGMAAAARLAADERAHTVERVGKLRDRLVDGLLASVPDAIETGVLPAGTVPADRSHKIAGVAHLCFRGIDSESLLFLLEQAEVFGSAASSCASGAQEPSHVLAAMGVPVELARGSLRLSLGAASVEGDVDRALDAVPAAVERLRRFA